MRAFLAFDISQDVIERLLKAEEELRQTRADIGLVGRENLHFTVKFLGDVPDDITSKIDGRVSGLELASFEVEMKGMGVFPDMRRPRIVWAGVAAQDEASITGRAEAVIEALDGIGKPDERDFKAHVTIGRVRSARNVEAVESFVRGNEFRDFGRTRVTSLKLKSSLLTPKGPIYTDVREYVLK